MSGEINAPNSSFDLDWRAHLPSVWICQPRGTVAHHAFHCSRMVRYHSVGGDVEQLRNHEGSKGRSKN